MNSLKKERFFIAISPCENVSDSAMASMLSSWVYGTARAQEWIGQDAIESMMRSHVLRLDDIETMTYRVLTALENSGLFGSLLMRTEELYDVVCEVKRNVAYVELQWGLPHGLADSNPTVEEANCLHSV